MPTAYRTVPSSVFEYGVKRSIASPYGVLNNALNCILLRATFAMKKYVEAKTRRMDLVRGLPKG